MSCKPIFRASKPFQNVSSTPFLVPKRFTSLLPQVPIRRPLASRCKLPSGTFLPTRVTRSTRWSSTAAEASTKEDTSSEAPQSSEEEDPTKKELQAKEREIIDLKDKYLRSVADFRNLQERARREQQAAKDFAIQRFAKDLIESIDNLDLALSNVPAEKVTSPESKETGTPDTYKELRELYGGLQMTSTVFLNTLRKHGLERFDPSENGDKFDPNLHEATFQAPQPGKEDGTVFHTVQKGFLLNGRVLRAPKVGVVKNS